MDVTCYLVNPAGCCSGVKRAIGMAEQVLKMYKEAYIVEDVVHNNIVMQRLFDAGLKKVSSIDEIPNGAVVLFSVHGVPPSVMETCERNGLTMVDATCSFVHDIQESIKKSASNGQKIVIIGDSGHPEIRGYLGCATCTDVFVVNNVEEVDMLPEFSDCEVVYYTQTTLRIDKAAQIVDAIKKKYKNINRESETDVCCTTSNRQIAVMEIAQNVDIVIVLGSRSSSNTTQLFEIAQDYGAKRTVFVEQCSDLDENMLLDVKSIAIVTGASTPDDIVEDTLSFLQSTLGEIDVHDVQQCKTCTED